jgi:hypothetical protein
MPICRLIPGFLRASFLFWTSRSASWRCLVPRLVREPVSVSLQ